MIPSLAELMFLVASLKALSQAHYYFLIFINDIVSTLNSSSQLFLFAEDARLFRYIVKQSDTIGLQRDLDDVHSWIKHSLLSLNVSECKVVLYGRNKSFDGQYCIDGERLEKVESVKDLGITFDTNLKFMEHITEKNQ